MKNNTTKKMTLSAKARRLFTQGHTVIDVSNSLGMNYGHAWAVKREMDLKAEAEGRKAAPLTELNTEITETSFSSMPEPTGGSSDYYKVHVAKPTSGGKPYMAECNDIIESLGMTFAEGNILKALWRRAVARTGSGKQGNSPLYDSEKIEFFAKRLVNQDRDYA
jgi:hypothetical protein